MHTVYQSISLMTVIFFLMLGNVWGMTGSELLEDCIEAENFLLNKTSQKMDYSQVCKSCSCTGYVMGIADSFRIYDAAIKIPNKDKGLLSVCIPNGVDYKQIVRIVIKFLRDTPEGLHDPAEILVMAALHRAFPCQ